MKNIFAFLLLFSACISNAQQNTLNNVGLTSVAPASVAFSVRQLSTSYTGPLLRIKVGTSFYDVYPDATSKKFAVTSKISAPISTYNAAIAVASANALSSLITASTNATVAIWYDQSGNAIHVFSSNGSAQIITTGSINMMNGQPTIRFFGSGSTSYLTSTTAVNYSTQTLATVNAVVQNVASTDLVSGIIATGNSGGWGLNYDPTNSFKGYWIDGSGDYGATVNENSTDAKIITGVMGTSISSSIYSNSVLKGTKASHAIANGVGDLIYVGIRGYYSTTRQFNGNISETILFPKNLTSTEQTALEASQSIYLPIGVTITSSATGTVCSGTSVTFTATTTGITSPSYQWYKNSVAINGATSATYTTTALSNNDVINVMAVEGNASVTTSGLVLNLDAGNLSSYTSGATTWTDLTANGNHGTLNNVTYNSSNQGYLSFNGTSSFVSLPNSTDFNFGTGDFTIELWVQNSSATKTPNLLAVNSNNSFYSSVRIGWAPNINGNPTVTFNHSTNGTSWAVQTGFTGSFSSWTQIVLSRTAGVVTMYANGVNKGTYNLAGSLMTTTTSNPIYNQIGTLPNWQSVYTLLGNMSIVRYYKAAGLTSSQVVSNYNAICSRYSLNPIGINSNSITTTITAGPSATLTVLGDGCINKTTLSTTSGQTSYTWYKDGGAISGVTNNTYKPTTAGEYKVQVLNGTCASMSTLTTISTCGVTASGRMSILETSTTLVSKAGAKNNGKGVSERGKILNQPSPPLITTGLQLHYDAGNVSSYSNPSATWNDISGNTGRNATFVNSPTFNTGNGGSIYTNGLDQYAQTSYTGSATDSYTFSAWFKNDNYSEPKYILGRGRDGAGNGWSLQLQVSTGGIVTAGVVPTVPSTIGIVANGTSTLALNTWYYVTGVWTAGQSIKVYVNGSLQGTTTTAGTSLRTSTNGWWIGSISTTIFTSGYNAVAQVYNSVLSDAQILQNFNADKTRFGY